MSQKGQIILILILVMAVALAIGLSIVQKSLVDVSTASKVEQSSRAFSAAEAGIEKALQESTTTIHSYPDFSIDNSSKVQEIIDTGLLPCIPGTTDCGRTNDRQAILEKPPLNNLSTKTSVTQVWLADFDTYTNPPPVFYTQSSLDVYWGEVSSAEKPAIEIKIVYYVGGAYLVKPFFLDSNGSRAAAGNFINASSVNSADVTSDCDTHSVNTTSGTNRQFYCKSTLKSLPADLMLLRARLLYSSTSPFAVAATGAGDCTGSPNYSGCYLKPQDRIIVSTGVSGETQRRVKIYQESKVTPPFFDYALFSAGAINK